MTGQERWDDVEAFFEHLPKVQLSSEDKHDVWRVIEDELENSTTKATGFVRYRRWYRGGLAAVVSAAVLVGGVLAYQQVQPMTTRTEVGSASGVSMAASLNPEMYVFPNWDVVVTPTLRQKGKVDVAFYYTGPTPAYFTRFEGTRPGGGPQSVMEMNPPTGSILMKMQGNEEGVPAIGQGGFQPSELAGYSATLYWIVKGDHKTQTIQLRGQQPQVLRVLRQVHQTGLSQHWNADVVGLVVGNSTFVSDTNLNLVLSYRGSDTPPGKVALKVKEGSNGYFLTTGVVNNGKIDVGTGITGGDYHTDSITAVELTWQGHTETVHLENVH